MQIVPARLNLRQQLLPLFFLLSLERTPLLSGIFLPQFFDSFRLSHFQLRQLVSVVDGLFDSLVHCDQLFVVLHFAQLSRRFDFSGFNSSAQLLVQHVHLLIVALLKFVDLGHVLVLLLLKVLLPLDIEFLQGFLANFNIVFELSLLDIRSKFVLVCHNFCFEESDFAHQILIELIFEDFAALVRQQLHLLLDDSEEQDLLILVQQSITTIVEHLN